MGYITEYVLRADRSASSVDAHTLAKGVDADGMWTPVALDEWDASGKWHEWRAGVAALSRDYPDVRFTVDGAGEDSGDIWRAYAHGGAVVMANTVIRHSLPPWCAPKGGDACQS